MRIAHILLTKYFAGTERHVLQLGAAQSTDHDVHLIMHRKGVGSHARSISEKVPASINTHVVGSALRQWTFVQVRRELKRIRPDIIHCHLNAACKSVLRDTSAVPRVATLHIDYDPKQHDHMQGSIAITPFQQERMPPTLRNKSVQIDNWCESAPVSETAARALRAQYKITDDEFVIGTLGRIESAKNQQLMIESALRAGAQSQRPFRVVVVGDGRQLVSLRARYPQVLFPGFSTQANIWLKAFDLFVSSADEEPFGLVFLEALEQSTPVVASPTEGALHLTKRLPVEVVAGWDSKAFSAAIEKYIKASRQCLTPTVKRALNDFAVAQKSQQTLAFYEQVLASA